MISCEYISERRPARLEADALELLEAADHQLNVGLDPEPAVSVSQTYTYIQPVGRCFRSTFLIQNFLLISDTFLLV